jgi:excinuclease UvrABC helicase subunit UvrB
MKEAIEETARRREIHSSTMSKHGITPATIRKTLQDNSLSGKSRKKRKGANLKLKLSKSSI